MKRRTINRYQRSFAWLMLAGVTGALVASCSRVPSRYSQSDDGLPVDRIDVAATPDATPRVEPPSKYGNPASYVVGGRRYYTLTSSKGYKERGTASWYGTKFHGYRTSSGDVYDMYLMTAAHKTLPLPTYARVTNLDNGRAVIVKVNDRGPFHSNRLIDLSYAAASKLDLLHNGTGRVEVEALDAQPVKPAQVQAAAVVQESKPKYAAATAPARAAATQPRAKAAATASAKSAAPKGGALYLQLGAFRDRANAQRLQSNLASSNFEGVSISEGTSDQHPVYRVRIGPLADVQTAETLSRMLHDQGIASPHIVTD